MTDEIDSLEELIEELRRMEQNARGTASKVNRLESHVHDLESRLERVEDAVQDLELGLSGQQHDKLTNYLAILEHAERSGRGPAGTLLRTSEISAAASCSPRSARRYMRDLATRFEWASVREGSGRDPNQLQIDLTGRSLADCREHVRETFDTADSSGVTV